MENLKVGGMLTGQKILEEVKEGNIKIDPFDETCINPNSYNLKLHPTLKIYTHSNKDLMNALNGYDWFPETKLDLRLGRGAYGMTDIHGNHCNSPIIPMFDRSLGVLDMKAKNDTYDIEIPEEGLILVPGLLYIGRTVEKTSTDKYIPMINGRSSIGRLGISIHITAGFGDIGFSGTWTLEISVVQPVRIYPNVEIAQICYFTPIGDVDKLYRGRYYNQEEATGSRFYLGKEGNEK